MPLGSLFRRSRGAAGRFEELLRPHVDYLYRLAWRFTGNEADAEDLVQDLLLKLYPRAAELAALQSPRPWLARVLYRQYVDAVRQRSRRPPADLIAGDEDPLAELPAETDGPEAHAERGELQARLLRALARLNPEQRAVVAMHDIEGYTLEELEKILDTPIGTLKSRLHRARAALREALGMEPFAPAQRVMGRA
jgi:RNA polymerase sigma factor (sigma-70 family)